MVGAGPYEQGNESSISVKDDEFLPKMSDYRILKKVLLYKVSYEGTSRKGHFYRYIALEPFRIK
jgi:hypothetical protein